MRRTGSWFAVVALVGASIVGFGDTSTAQAATASRPVTSGTATVAIDWSTTFTLSGTIAVGDGVFEGTANGTAPGPDFEPAAGNPVRPFALQGPGLTGTCSGLWIADPASGPANVVSLACTLQLGLAPPAPTSLTLAVVAQDAPADHHFSGVFGPGISSIPVAAPPSRGVIDVATVSDPPTVEYHLVGDISIGGQVFHGDAGGAYDPSAVPPHQPFAVTGASPSGNLTAMCDDSQSGFLTCTGQVGNGPAGTATLIVLTPLESDRNGDGCGHCFSSDATGVFLGA